MRKEDFDPMPHMQQLQLPNLIADTRTALASLERGKPTFLVGFCLGGALSILSSAEDLGLTGASGFYASLSRQWAGNKGSALEVSVQVRNPFLGLFGGADERVPLDQVHALDENLDKAGVEHEILIYESAPHIFFDRSATEYAEACNDAWQKVLAFLQSTAPDILQKRTYRLLYPLLRYGSCLRNTSTCQK